MAEPVQLATVLSATNLTPNVRQLVLQPQHKLDFSPGQWVSLKLPVGPHPPLTRAYSMAEPASPAGTLTLVFDRVPHGLGSTYLFQLQVGDTVSLSGPYGHFLSPQLLDRELLCITRYTGLVPIHCLLKAWKATRHRMPVFLIAVGPAEDELLYHFELLTLAVTCSVFHYFPLVTSTDTAAVAQVIDVLRPWLRSHHHAQPLLCGTKPFVHPLRQYLMEAGYARKEIRVETYG
ncbi:MAG: FAD-binding oxidoreductase [Nitrospira sp.]|nr:FAD-binding oxidoreductase [Nitrospira sp.]